MSRSFAILVPMDSCCASRVPSFFNNPLLPPSALAASEGGLTRRAPEPRQDLATALPRFADARRLATRARWPQRQFCMIAAALCSLVARSTNIDLRGNFSQPTQARCLGAPEAAHPLLAGSRLYSAGEPNGWATFSLLVLAPAHLNRDGGGNKEVIRPPNCRTVAQRGRNGARWHCQSLPPAHPQRTNQLRAGEG